MIGRESSKENFRDTYNVRNYFPLIPGFYKAQETANTLFPELFISL